MKVSFSLANAKAKAAKPVGAAPALKKPVTFASLEDDEPVDGAATAGSSSRASTNKRLVAQNVEMSRAMKKKLEEEKKVDATVFEYDEVWDKMQESKLRQKETKEVDARERKVRWTGLVIRLRAVLTLGHSQNILADCSIQLLPDDWTTSGQRRR